MTDTTIALVTGANKGIGHEVRRLAGQGWTVLLGSRDPASGMGSLAVTTDPARFESPSAGCSTRRPRRRST